MTSNEICNCTIQTQLENEHMCKLKLQLMQTWNGGHDGCGLFGSRWCCLTPPQQIRRNKRCICTQRPCGRFPSINIEKAAKHKSIGLLSFQENLHWICCTPTLGDWMQAPIARSPRIYQGDLSNFFPLGWRPSEDSFASCFFFSNSSLVWTSACKMDTSKSFQVMSTRCEGSNS